MRSLLSINGAGAIETDKGGNVNFELMKFEDKILNIIDNQDDFTRSGLQGIVTAVVRNIYKAGENSGLRIAMRLLKVETKSQ